MAMNTAAFTKALLARVKKDFSRLDYKAVTAMMGDLHTEYRECNAERKSPEKRSDRMFASDSIE